MARHVQPAGRQQGAVEESATGGGWAAFAMAGQQWAGGTSIASQMRASSPKSKLKTAGKLKLNPGSVLATQREKAQLSNYIFIKKMALLFNQLLS